jgi:hypothetical protein
MSTKARAVRMRLMGVRMSFWVRMRRLRLLATVPKRQTTRAM